VCVVKPSFDRTPIAKGVRSSYAAQKPSPKGLAKYRTGHPPAESGFKTLAIDNGTIGTLFPLEFGSDSDADVVLLDRFDRGFFIYIGFFKEKLSNFAKGRPETGRKPLALPESAKVVFPAGRGAPLGPVRGICRRKRRGKRKPSENAGEDLRAETARKA